MAEPDVLRTLSWILQAVEVVGWPPERQLEYLHALGVGGLADELALQVNDTIAAVDQLAEQGQLPTSSRDAVHAVDAQLAQMSTRGPDLWSEQAVRSAPA